MTRHAVIIGVGGTGTYILTLVKKELMELNRGKMPDTVKLLAFDTLPESGEGGQQKVPENVISIQNVKLENDVEFIGLQGNGWALGESTVKGEAPQLGRWFDAETYRKSIPPALWDLAGGAGRIRQFGRLAFFMKVDAGIRLRIQNAFSAINGLNQGKKNEVEVIIVSSFAGGTGAGMFIDMGILCRDLGGIFNNQMIIRGIFVLPSAFVNLHAVDDEGRKMMARSFAAWRELDRYMNLGPGYGAHKISYKNNNQMDVAVNARPFDECFLVDRRSEINSLETVDAKNGVFPVVANFISLVLDPKAGAVFAERDRNNIVPINERTSRQGYTALRTYTVKVPIYYDMEVRALKLSKDLLDRWLAPSRGGGKITGLADNKNGEAPNTQGRDAVIPFLQAPNQRIAAVTNRMSVTQGAGQQSTLANTAFLPHIADIWSLRGNASGLQTQKETDAWGGYIGEALNVAALGGKLAVLPADANQTKIVVNKIPKEADVLGNQSECNTHLWDEVKPSEEYGDLPIDALDRFLDPQIGISNFEKIHLGAGSGNSGKFGGALEESRLFQVGRFAELLRQWMLNTLNGTQIEPFVGLAGKLGYVKDFCDELVNALDFYTNKYLNEVKKIRAQQNPLQNATELEAAAKSGMEDWADHKCAFFFHHPRAYVRQNQYIVAVDDRMQVERDNMVLDAMMTTSSEMLNVARQAQAKAESWVKALGTGGQNHIGLLPEVEREANLVSGYLDQEQITSPTQWMTPARTYKAGEINPDVEMKRISWSVDTSDGNFKVKCQLAVPTTQVDEEGNPINEVKDLSAGDTGVDLEANKTLIKQVCRNVYRNEWKSRLALDEAMNMRPDPIVLANEMKDHSDILARYNQANVNVSEHIPSVYLRVMNPAGAVHTDASNYLNQVKEQICRTLGLPVAENITVESEDQYKITLLRTTHRIQDSDLDIWDQLRKEYHKRVTQETTEEGAARLHIFPAERASSMYESQLTNKLDKEYRAFHPEVVMLLEYEERVNLFFRCKAYGFIKNRELPNSAQHLWYFEIPDVGAEYGQKVDLITTELTDEGTFREPTWFEIINAFALVGHAYNNQQSRINWDSLKKAMAMYEAQLRKKEPVKEAEKSQGSELNARIDFEINNPEGIVKSLEKIANDKRRLYSKTYGKDPTKGGWSWNDDGTDYMDLADLAHLMLLKQLN